MSGKASLLLAVFVVIAGTAVFGAFNILTPSGQTATILAADPALTVAAKDVDTDKDGLTDAQESVWRTSATDADTDGDGFLDGEEVASGHDPRIKGPNDAFIKPLNLTQKTASLIAGGTAVGDLTSSNPTYNAALNRLTEAITLSFQENLAVKEDTLTTVADSQQARKSYTIAMAWMIKKTIAIAIDDGVEFLYSLNDIPLKNLELLTNDTARYTAYQVRMHELSRLSGSYAAQLSTVAVPVPLRQTHAELVRAMRILERQYAIAATLKEDPVSGTLAVQALVKMHTQHLPSAIGMFAESLSTPTTP